MAVRRSQALLLRAGLLGRGIESRSPQMHEAEGARLGLRYEYRLFDFDRLALRDAELPRLMTRLREEGFSGVNVTHPFKEHIVPHLDRLSSDAAAIGAVNTVVFDAQGTVGHNTDCWGSQKASAEGSAGRVSKRSSFLAPAAAVWRSRARCRISASAALRFLTLMQQRQHVWWRP